MYLSRGVRLCILLITVVQSFEIGTTLITLEGFQFNAEKDNSCYHIYGPTENIDKLTCKKVKKGERSCVTGLTNDEQQCSINTPSNESIIVPCTSYPYPMKDSLVNDFYYGLESGYQCFSVVKQDMVRRVCPKLIDHVGIIATTPDNYSILLEALGCDSVKKRTEIEADRDFVLNFQFDPEENLCYQIYPQNYDFHLVYTCSDNKISTSCVEKWDKNENCTVIKSPLNEVVILECDGRQKRQNNCLDVYVGDIKSEVCLEELEEGCVGFILPSGLKMLVACRKCIEVNNFSPFKFYNKEVVKKRSNFFRHFLQNEKEHKNSYFKNKFEILYKKTRVIIYPYWLSNTCYGLTLPTYETVTLQCTDKVFDRPGCFLLTTPNGTNEEEICATMDSEGCVILKTPQGIEIFLSCLESVNQEIQIYLQKVLAQFNDGSYDLTKKYYTSLYKLNNFKIGQTYPKKWLFNYNCYGIVTEDLETVLLDCPNGKSGSKNGCFKIYAQKYGPGNEIVDSSQEEHEACVKILNENCVGISTIRGWYIAIDCYLTGGGASGVINPKPNEPTEMI